MLHNIPLKQPSCFSIYWSGYKECTPILVVQLCPVRPLTGKSFQLRFEERSSISNHRMSVYQEEKCLKVRRGFKNAREYSENVQRYFQEETEQVETMLCWIQEVQAFSDTLLTPCSVVTSHGLRAFQIGFLFKFLWTQMPLLLLHFYFPAD